MERLWRRRLEEEEEEEGGGRCAEGLEEGECSSMTPTLRFFTSPCSPESRLWELVEGEGGEGSGGEEWPRGGGGGGCVRL